MDIRPIIEDIEYLKHVYGDCPAEELLDVLKVDALRRIANALEKGQEETNENMDQDVLTSKQAMAALNVKDYRTLNKLIEAGLPAIKVGTCVRFSKSDISELLEKHKERKNDNG